MQSYSAFFKKTLLNYNKISVNDFEKNDMLLNNFVTDAAKTQGLRIVKDKNNETKVYYKNNLIGKLYGIRPDTTLRPAFEICRNKFTLEEYLKKAEVQTLSSAYFSKKDKAQALEYIKSNNGESYVLKPLNMAGGKGIMLNVNEENFSLKWDKSIAIQDQENIEEIGCIVQPFVRGFDIRVSIIEGRYTASILRFPAHVIGNNEKTIRELIEEKNKDRERIRYFRDKLIVINYDLMQILTEQNLKLDHVIKKDEVVILSDISNLTMGGESVDVTNKLSEDIKNLAINAVAAIPGLYSAGVDIMAENYLTGDGYIIEVNTHANLTMHYLPIKGRQRRPYHIMLNYFLINHKAKGGFQLSSKELSSYIKFSEFLRLKNIYAAKIAKKDFYNNK